MYWKTTLVRWNTWGEITVSFRFCPVFLARFLALLDKKKVFKTICSFTYISRMRESTDQDTLMRYDQMRFIFQNRLSCGPHISSIDVTVLRSQWFKFINRRYKVIIWTFQPMTFSVHPGIYKKNIYICVCVCVCVYIYIFLVEHHSKMNCR